VRQNRSKFQQQPELVSMLFNQLYERVDPKFFTLAIFAIRLAKERNIPLNNRTVFKQPNLETELMFYYAFNKRKELQFTLIDSALNFLYFRA
jgi:hypothetical protein